MSSVATRPLTASHPSISAHLLLPLRLWHLLSLDAPTVAVLWMLFLAHGSVPAVQWHQAAALGLTVWVLYVLDRILDARILDARILDARHSKLGPRDPRQSSTGCLRDRHLFHFRHRRLLVGGILACLAPILILTIALPSHLRTAWLLLSLPLLVYATVIHRLHLPRLPKEVCVALIFSIAAAMPALLQSPPQHRPVFGAVLFAALCWMNCVAIARWEGLPSSSTARTTQWGARHLPWVGAALMASCALCTLPFARTPGLPLPQLACALGTALLLLLDTARYRIPAIELRGLADAALLTPLLLWPLLRG